MRALLLLRLFPKRYREAYGEEMREVVRYHFERPEDRKRLGASTCSYDGSPHLPATEIVG